MTRPAFPPRSSGILGPGQIARPIVGLDIDGTIGCFHDHFLNFAEGWFGKTFLRGYDGSEPLHRWMGVSKDRYRQCKMAYRKGGLKRSMPVIDGAKEFSQKVRAAGAMIIICTTRPFLMLDNVDPDTREWLRRNGIQHDMIIHGEHKYRDLSRVAAPGVVIMVHEDLVPLADQAYELGLRPVLAVRAHNRTQADWLHYPATDTLRAAQGVALQRIANYLEERS